MKLVIISGYACGYYSESEWKENIFITEEGYNKIKDKVDELDIHIGELDGKHSETMADIEVEIVNEKDFEKYSWEGQYSGDVLVENLSYMLSGSFDIDEERKLADEIIKNIDSSVSLNVTVKKSQVDKVKKFIESL